MELFFTSENYYLYLLSTVLCYYISIKLYGGQANVTHTLNLCMYDWEEYFQVYRLMFKNLILILDQAQHYALHMAQRFLKQALAPQKIL